MLNRIKGIHIEPTNKCTLKCPLCARTDMINRFPKSWQNQSVNLAEIKNFLDIDLRQLTIKLCGNTGDPIYYDDLIPMLEYFKQAGSRIIIGTNGSHKTQQWWNLMLSFLDSEDQIIFAIDGLPSNFTKYRINADWESIEIGIKEASKSKVQLKWQMIPFNFNEQEISQVKQLAESLGADFFLKLSNRWQGTGHEYKPKKIEFTKYKDNLLKNEIDPLCKNDNDQHYITASGYYTSCCYVSDHRFYYKSEFHKNRERYRISNTTISQILTDTSVVQFYDTIQDVKLEYCLHNCPKI